MAATESPDTTREAGRPIPAGRSRQARMRVAINLLTENPEHPSGAHWFWTRVIPEMAKRLESGEQLHLLVSPKSRPHSPGVRAGRLLHHLSVVERTAQPAHAERAPVLAGAAAAQPNRRLQHLDGAGRELPLVAGPALQDHACLSRRPTSITPLPRLYRRMNYPRSAAGGGCDHHQLREPACGDPALPGGRSGEAQADLRGGRPRPVPAGRRRRGPGSRRAVRRDQAVRALRVLAVAVQELRRIAAGVGAGAG